jgi:hypothetical protein
MAAARSAGRAREDRWTRVPTIYIDGALPDEKRRHRLFAAHRLGYTTRQSLTFDDFSGPRDLRMEHVQELQEAGRLDEQLRWRLPVHAA